VHHKVIDLRVHTSLIDSFLSFRPTINLFADFSHSLSLEATGDASRFAIDASNLISWRARVEACPGASARNR